MGAPGVQYTIDPPCGAILRCPARDGPLHFSRFGEADLKAALFAAEHAVGETLLFTIDWDMVVQGAAVLPVAALVLVELVVQQAVPDVVLLNGTALPQ